MFGEEYMLGIVEFKPDEKGRIIIPNFTGIQGTDVLSLIQKESYLEIWNRVDIVDYLKELDWKMKESTDLETIREYQRISNQITSMIANGSRRSYFIQSRGIVRVNLGTKLRKQYQLQDGGVMEGKGHYLRIWNVEKFREYKNQLGEFELQEVIGKRKVKKRVAYSNLMNEG